MAHKIAIANQKGGVGKTTTAICLAQELQRRQYSVLIIDSDPQCNTTAFYEAETEGVATLADILYSTKHTGKECIQQIERGDIIPSDKNLSDAENYVKADEIRFKHLKRYCKDLEDLYDFIIIDTPPALGVVLKNVLAYADRLIIPIQESGWAIEGLMDFAEAITMAQEETNENLKVSGLLTVMSKQRTRKSARIGKLAEHLSGILKTHVYTTKIRESTKCTEALTEYHVPLYEYAPLCNAQIDYECFVDEFLKWEGYK